jgi:tetratricopeptide (TPR) repeat protein
VRPTNERAVLALKAIHESRWSDAQKHIAAIPESPLGEYAWKMYLAGLLAGERDEFPKSETALLAAASAAFVVGFADEKSVAADALRFGAAVLEKLGFALRRQERLDAYHAHLAAYRLREEHGSFDEQWETAMSLAVDCTVARRDDEAQRWCRAAIGLAGETSDQPFAKQAQSWGRLAAALTSLGRHEEAVTSARTAREFWRKHDRSAVTAARADLDLAGVLMKHAESVYETDCAQAKKLLNEALAFLATAADELPPFGPEAVADVRRCTEQTDFARRLLDSL